MSTTQDARIIERATRKSHVPSSVEVVEALAKLEFSHLFDYLSLKKLAGHFTLKRYAHRSIIHHGGDERNVVFGLVQGYVKVMSTNREGELALLDVLAPGVLFGEDLLYSETPRDRTFVAYDNVIVASISKEDLQSLLPEYPQLQNYIFRTTGERLRRAEERLITLALEVAQVRLARVLSELALRCGTVQEDGSVRINLKLPHHEIADMVGSTRESVNGHLRELRRRGLIDLQERCVTIHDLLKLTAITE